MNTDVSTTSMFLRFMDSIIARHWENDHQGSYKNYLSTANNFRAFLHGKDVPISLIDSRMMEDYEEYLRSTGLVPNSTSFYMKILRAVYNRAVEEGLTTDKKPFRSVFTGMEKTRKRAISTREITLIRELDLSTNPALEFARDVFLFLFFCRGMSFVDAAFLRKKDVKGGAIHYRRLKTGQKLTIKLVEEISRIVERYTVEGSPFLLPVLSDTYEESSRKQYTTALRRINRCLKTIGEMANLGTLLTTYVSRHSWATIAKQKYVPLPVISDALGHDSLTTTQIYLASIETSVIDNANDRIIRDL